MLFNNIVILLIAAVTVEPSVCRMLYIEQNYQQHPVPDYNTTALVAHLRQDLWDWGPVDKQTEKKL